MDIFLFQKRTAKKEIIMKLLDDISTESNMTEQAKSVDGVMVYHVSCK